MFIKTVTVLLNLSSREQKVNKSLKINEEKWMNFQNEITFSQNYHSQTYDLVLRSKSKVNSKIKPAFSTKKSEQIFPNKRRKVNDFSEWNYFSTKLSSINIQFNIKIKV